MRTRVRRLVVALVVLLLATGGGLLARHLWNQKKGDLALQALDLLPNVAQRIRDFHRVKVDNGRKVWEVSAKEAQYHEDEEMVVVKEPMVSFFLEDGRVVALRGNEGKVYLLGGRDLQLVELAGEIEVELGDYAVRAEYASYDRSSDVVVAPGKVEISGETFDLQGQHMEVVVGSQRLTLSGGVETTLRPRS
jgi:LPS export ABC transporter protein LptC